MLPGRGETGILANELHVLLSMERMTKHMCEPQRIAGLTKGCVASQVRLLPLGFGFYQAISDTLNRNSTATTINCVFGAASVVGTDRFHLLA